MEQIRHSIPHYFEELSQLHGARQLYFWIYHKLPFAFPLPKFPPYVTVEATNACNLACRHCWRSIMDREIGAIDVELFRKIVCEIGYHPPTTLKIGGTGEAALHPNFKELISAVPQGIQLILYTNGSLLQFFPYEEILSWNITTLVVSVDGIDCESYEKIRVGGKYDLLQDSVDKFYAQRNRLGRRTPEIEIRHVIMPNESGQELAQFRKMWLSIADTVKFNALIPLNSPKAPRDTPCRHIRREFCIEWDGKVRFCSNYPQYYGSVHSRSIQELWRSPAAEFVRHCQRRGEFEKIPACKECRPVAKTGGDVDPLQLKVE